MCGLGHGLISAALEAIDEAVGVYDADDRLTGFNARYVEVRSAIGGDVHRGARWDDLAVAAALSGNIPEAVGREEEWLRSRRKQRGAYSVRRRIADGRWFQVNERRMPNGGVAVVWTDISELVRTEQKLQAALRGVEAANAAKTEAVYNVGHELRAPLTAILGYAEMITNEVLGPLPHRRYAEFVGHIQFAAECLMATVDTLLDIAKIESRTLELHKQVCDLDDLVDTALPLVQPQGEKKSVAINHVRGGPQFSARLDKQRMRQVLVNLLSNAVKFTPNGGSVEVGVRAASNGSPVLYVSDTGIGIAPADIDKVTLPFGTARGSLVRNAEGTGLGLALSKAIVEAHGGTLRLESRLGVGTTVFVGIPAETASADCFTVPPAGQAESVPALTPRLR